MHFTPKYQAWEEFLGPPAELKVFHRNVYGTFEEHLQKVLEWKKNPDEFIKELIEYPTQDSLHEAIKEKLVNDSK